MSGYMKARMHLPSQANSCPGWCAPGESGRKGLRMPRKPQPMVGPRVSHAPFPLACCKLGLQNRLRVSAFQALPGPSVLPFLTLLQLGSQCATGSSPSWLTAKPIRPGLYSSEGSDLVQLSWNTLCPSDCFPSERRGQGVNAFRKERTSGHGDWWSSFCM